MQILLSHNINGKAKKGEINIILSNLAKKIHTYECQYIFNFSQKENLLYSVPFGR